MGIEKFERLIEQSDFKDFILIEDLLQLNPSNLEKRFENIDVITILGGSLIGVFCYKNQQRAWNKITNLLPTGGRIIFDSFMIDGFENYQANTRNQYTIFPNPLSNKTILKFENPTQEHCALFIYDSYGRLVRKIEHITNDQVDIDRNDFSPGLFTFEIVSVKRIVKGKFVVN